MKCKAKDDKGRYRGEHKPVAGIYNGVPMMSCAWCGAWLGEGKAGE